MPNRAMKSDRESGQQVRCLDCSTFRPQDVIDCPVCDVPSGHVHGTRADTDQIWSRDLTLLNAAVTRLRAENEQLRSLLGRAYRALQPEAFLDDLARDIKAAAFPDASTTREASDGR